MKPIALITARGGSKRIPKKNIKNFLGKPMIAYPIEACLKSKLFSHVVVSTDDKKIASISKKYGASVPFMRSKKNSDDWAGTDDVVLEVIEQLKKSGIVADTFCIIYPTAVFIDQKTIVKMKSQFIKQRFDSMMTITSYSSPIQRALEMSNGKVKYWIPKFMNHRSQDLKTMYYDAGQAYWIRTKAFLKNKTLVSKNMGGFYLPPSQVQDIDTPDDLEMAQMKVKLLSQR